MSKFLMSKLTPATTGSRKRGITYRAVIALTASSLFAIAGSASAQTVPVAVNVSGNVATVQVGNPAHPLADLTITFDDARGLSAASLGVSAKLVDLADPALIARLPDPRQTQPDPALPLMITIEPPHDGGFSFVRTARVELHTHALVYSVGSSYRLIKAPLGGSFRDITDEIAPGSVRARGTTGGFSQFLVVTDVRTTGTVVAEKLGWLRADVATLPSAEQPAFASLVDAADASVASGDYANAIAALDAIRARAAARGGSAIANVWRAGGGADNQAGKLIADATTAKFSVAYLRDYGQ
ncbi:MAG: hypothetical protein M3R16_11005 [Pseudomonadota bacterium]|nr:hypothetical protein [Pseudomonadota bacterium]